MLLLQQKLLKMRSLLFFLSMMIFWLVKLDGRILRLQIRRVDPTLDMEADQGDDYIHLPDHGILRDGSKEITDSEYEQYKRTLSQDLNWHAAVVLEGRALDVVLGDTRTVAEALASSKQAKLASEISYENENQESLERVSRMAEIEDLQAPRGLPFSPLCIKMGERKDKALKELRDQLPQRNRDWEVLIPTSRTSRKALASSSWFPCLR